MRVEVAAVATTVDLRHDQHQPLAEGIRHQASPPGFTQRGAVRQDITYIRKKIFQAMIGASFELIHKFDLIKSARFVLIMLIL